MGITQQRTSRKVLSKRRNIVDVKGYAANIGLYASWARHYNVNQLQSQAVVRAGQTTFNFSSYIQLDIFNQQWLSADE
jgi:hypothetical protein